MVLNHYAIEEKVKKWQLFGQWPNGRRPIMRAPQGLYLYSPVEKQGDFDPPGANPAPPQRATSNTCPPP